MSASTSACKVEQVNLQDFMSSVLNKINNNHIIAIGQDSNVQVGIRGKIEVGEPIENMQEFLGYQKFIQKVSG